MGHTYLFEEGRWQTKGMFFDHQAKLRRAEGFSRFRHKQDSWLLESKLSILGDQGVKLSSLYEIEPFTEKEHSTTWASKNQGMGELKGKFVVVSDTIMSIYHSPDAGLQGAESLLQMDENLYKSRGALFFNDTRVSSWAMEIRRKV